MIIKKILLGRAMPLFYISLLLSIPLFAQNKINEKKSPVDYVNPYMGNISHLLVPTYPTIHLPNSMMRIYPERRDFTSDYLHGLPIIVTSHRGSSAFNLSPFQGDISELRSIIPYSYDQEKITPYSYHVFLDEQEIEVDFGLSHQSAKYGLTFSKNKPYYLIVNSRNGELVWEDNSIGGYQNLANNTRVYMFGTPSKQPKEVFTFSESNELIKVKKGEAHQTLILKFDTGNRVSFEYGISFIDKTQASNNLNREVKGKSIIKIHEEGRKSWNDALGKIEVSGGSEENKKVFYTSFYRCFERPVCISEDGRYFSAFDGKVHEDDDMPFYTDDWIWDSYRAHHPLRILIDPDKENDIILSFLRMSEQMDDFWLPTFPEITGDSRRMNSNHGVATLIDAYRKGIDQFDLEKAYKAAKGAITEKTLAPWSGKPAGYLSGFYGKHGYIPALYPGEKETVPEVSGFEKRQPVAVTLGTSYDDWCLAQIAKELNFKEESAYFLQRSYNYRNLFNDSTGFFHPKDDKGQFIKPFDYKFSGGTGAREYYGENNGWTYRWDVQHNIEDLIFLMGGKDNFAANLDHTFSESLGRSKNRFYAQLPDQTGNVGQFSMANEPSLHIPYLYNYVGQPWKTQKRIRSLIKIWFRNDLMGVPGDEDGGGMSSFVVFSQMGFYPITPGLPIYTIGSPFFEKVIVHLSNGKDFTIIATGNSDSHKYIQSASLNDTDLEVPWISHDDIMKGGVLEFVMGEKANKEWGNKQTNTIHSQGILKD
ncbi:GH92 family glycosyl hydrolase [Echinicola sp. 20G]|uniref:GH92 family glycosyl hydrolase n=1 Tax=Echinicola sp. 20G TaxID=2781961 RepID=UPI001F2BEA99|nr:GH92 family glycosyl hydrolase [Echinicola sp. 20G]